MIPEIESLLLEDWDTLVKVRRPRKLHYLAIPGATEGGSTTVLAFSGNEALPVLAIKIHRSRDAGVCAQREHDLLEFLSARLPGAVPRPILCVEVSGRWVLVQEAIHGSPLSAGVSPAGAPDLLKARQNIRVALGFLVRLDRAARNVPYRWTPRADELSVLEEVGAIFNLAEAEASCLQQIREPLSKIATHLIRHGDFSPHNIFVGRDYRARVVDWTDGGPTAFPMHDAFAFLTTYQMQARGAAGLPGFGASFAEAFLGKTPYAAVVREFLVTHAAAVGVSATDLEPLLMLFLAQRSVQYYRQVLMSCSRGGLPRHPMFLAAREGLSYADAQKAQFWIYLLRMFIGRRDEFRAGIAGIASN